jgi:hypothetical protein
MANPCKNESPSPALRVEACLFFLGISALFVGLTLLSPTDLDNLPPLCVWSRILGKPCPGCGTTHALSALIHGEFRQAVGYNWNVVAVAPLLAWLWCQQLRIIYRSWPFRKSSSMSGTHTPELTRIPPPSPS